MDDLISRQAAIGTAISGRVRTEDGEKWIRVNEVKDSLLSLPSAQQWIPMTERPPIIENNVGKRVLVTTPWGMVGEATYCIDHWEIHDISYQIKSVIAWMPLPEPWKGEI